MDDKNMENGMTNGSQDDNKNNDNYEKICYMCRRPESKAGPMISMPGGMCLCHDCMQKAFDTVTKGGMDFSKMPNMPYMNMNFSDLSQMPPVNEIPQSQKLKKKKEPEKQLTMKDIPAPHVIKGGEDIVSEDGQSGIWDTNIFGKTVRQLVEEGIESKVNKLTDESQVKLQDTIQKVINDSNGGLVCIII